MTDNFQLNKQLCFSLYNAQRQMNRYYSNKVFKQFKLTYPQYLVLSILWENSPVNVKTLVNELALDTGTISPLLKRMEANELITRQRSELDQREVFVHLTEKSLAIKPELKGCTEIVKEAADFTDEEYEQLQSLLNKLIANLSDVKN